jgi:hypothetical protein
MERWKHVLKKLKKKKEKRKRRDGIKKEKTKNSRGSLHFNILGPTPPLSFFFQPKTGTYTRPTGRKKYRGEKRGKKNTEHYASPFALY